MCAHLQTVTLNTDERLLVRTIIVDPKVIWRIVGSTVFSSIIIRLACSPMIETKFRLYTFLYKQVMYILLAM